MGALLGDEMVYAEVADFVFSPRSVAHVLERGRRTCHILETISPGRLRAYFDELAARNGLTGLTQEKLGELGAKYGLEADRQSIPSFARSTGSGSAGLRG